MLCVSKTDVKCLKMIVFIITICFGISAIVCYFKTISTNVMSRKLANGLSDGLSDGTLRVASPDQPFSKSSFKEHTKLPECPKIPPNLRNNVQPEERWKAYEDDPSVLKHVEYGGSYQPRECRAREHVAIVVPMRDREEHLRKLLIHLHQFLPKQKISYRIFVAEMAQGPIFNTGIIQNVGFVIADNADNFTCFLIHDVDLMPTNENNLYTCDQVPIHFTTNSSKNNYRKKPKGYFGGVISLRRAMYYKVNGFSNLYFGWGGQDDDIRVRLVHVGLTPMKRARNIGVYEALPHERDAGNPINREKPKLMKNPAGRMSEDGLNSLQYRLLKYEERELYTWVLVNVNQTDVMAENPSRPIHVSCRAGKANKIVAGIANSAYPDQEPSGLGLHVHCLSISVLRYTEH